MYCAINGHVLYYGFNAWHVVTIRSTQSIVIIVCVHHVLLLLVTVLFEPCVRAAVGACVHCHVADVGAALLSRSFSLHPEESLKPLNAVHHNCYNHH